MKIVSHRLQKDDGTPYPFVKSPNTGGKYTPKYLVIHFTAGRSAESSISSLCNPASKASAHLVIGRDGRITQLVPFNTVAWHAGKSRWEGLIGLNSHSIGIELDNAGKLDRAGSSWESWFKAVYPNDSVIEAVHKNESRLHGWHNYTAEQIEATVEVGALLVAEYGLTDVLGHEDIAPTRKVDPGPAFPMKNYKARLMGRLEDEPFTYVTTEELNIRSGPGTINAEIPGSPLPPATAVQRIEREGNWWKVEVMTTINGVMDMEGWVHSKFLKRQ